MLIRYQNFIYTTPEFKKYDGRLHQDWGRIAQVNVAVKATCKELLDMSIIYFTLMAVLHAVLGPKG